MTKKPKLTSVDDIFLLNSDLEAVISSITQVCVDKLKPYSKHRFKLYTGERFTDMVESVRTNGILIPLIARMLDDGTYEILAGHNRFYAAIEAKLNTVPVIIKHDIDDETAEMYVTETNLIQRSFSEMSISEQALIVSSRHKQLFSQGKRNDIIKELWALEHGNVTSPPVANKSAEDNLIGRAITTTHVVGDEYGLSKDTVARLLRIYKLTDPFKAMVDCKLISIRAGVSLSYLPKEHQELLNETVAKEGFKITMDSALRLRHESDNGKFSIDAIHRILEKRKVIIKKVKISKRSMSKYFSDGQSVEEVQAIIDEALELYFRSKKNK